MRIHFYETNLSQNLVEQDFDGYENNFLSMATKLEEQTTDEHFEKKRSLATLQFSTFEEKADIKSRDEVIPIIVVKHFYIRDKSTNCIITNLMRYKYDGQLQV